MSTVSGSVLPAHRDGQRFVPTLRQNSAGPELNDRQEKALLRMFREGWGGFQGGLTAGKYSTMTGASPATATRDLADLVAAGGLVRVGERRHARYHLSVPLRPIPHVPHTETGELPRE